METVKCSFFYEGEEYEFEMRNRISFTEMAVLCHNVVGEMFSNGEYFPEFRDFAMWKEIIRAYTNVSLWDDSEDINEMNKNYELSLDLPSATKFAASLANRLIARSRSI